MSGYSSSWLEVDNHVNLFVGIETDGRFASYGDRSQAMSIEGHLSPEVVSLVPVSLQYGLR